MGRYPTVTILHATVPNVGSSDVGRCAAKVGKRPHVDIEITAEPLVG